MMLLSSPLRRQGDDYRVFSVVRMMKVPLRRSVEDGWPGPRRQIEDRSSIGPASPAR